MPEADFFASLPRLGQKPNFVTPLPSDTQLHTWSLLPLQELYQHFHGQAEGLSEEEAVHRLSKYGPNQIAQERIPRWYVQLFQAFRNPFVAMLGVIAGVSLFQNRETTFMIGVMVLISVLLRFSQERRSTIAAARLKELVRITATVVRKDAHGQANAKEVPVEDLVPGDIIKLAAGDLIPADVRLLKSKDLSVSQSALTGEALPVEKEATAALPTSANVLELPSLCFLGTHVLSGTATALVLATGAQTYLGSLAHHLVGRRSPTSFDRNLEQLGRVIVGLTVTMAVLVLLINGFGKYDALGKHNWSQAFLFALSVAVGLTPEMLPMIVSAVLALGSLAMARKRVIVKRLYAIQNLGAMDVLCTDKTGTLTEDKVLLSKHCNVGGEEDEDVFCYAYLNSLHQTNLKNLLDQAILDHQTLPIEDSKKIDEIPFDFSRRMMSVVLEVAGKRMLLAKGAPQEVLSHCSGFERDGTLAPIDSSAMPQLQAEIDQLHNKGFRVLSVAYKEVPRTQEIFSTKDENNLVLKGHVAFLDPPKETAAAAISALIQYGLQVKVLTGDNDIITRRVCTEVGIAVERVLVGSEIDQCNDAELQHRVDQTSVFARLTPAHKERIIQLLRKQGHVVGYLGDGINDAPALRAADVGISVNNAVDIAKESADVILLEKNLLVLQEGVLEGRKVFGNILKYIRMGLSSNFGNMLSVLGASLLFPFLPMMPIQLLVQNLLYDFSQSTIPLDHVDEETLRKPRKWSLDKLLRFVFVLGPVSSLFDYVLFGLMYFVFSATTLQKQSLFQTGWFVEGFLSQTLIVHFIRTRRIPFFQSRAAWPLTLTTCAIALVGLLLPFTPLGPHLHFVPLPGRYFFYLGGILLGYMLLTQGVKSWYAKRFGY